MIYNPVNKLFFRLWNSPTVTTWGSFLSRGLFAIVILPIITTKFSKEDINIWLILNIFIGFQNLTDLGFGITFIRAISYGMGGMLKIQNFKSNIKIEGQGTPNWQLIDKVYGTSSKLFFYFSLFFVLIFIVIGIFSLKNPIKLTGNQSEMWLAFGIIMLVTFLKINGNKYAIFLQGVNEIPLLKRWETFFGLLSIVTLFIVLQSTNTILFLIVAQQIFVLLPILRNKILAKNYNNQVLHRFSQNGIDKEVFKSLLPAALRSWIGVLMSYGVIQSTGLIVGQSSNAQLSSSYLFSLKVIDIIKNFSNAPFYSKIPLMSRLFAENKKEELKSIAENGIRLSLLVFVFGSMVVAFTGNQILEYINSNVTLSSKYVLFTLTSGYYFERYGAMHIQLYSLTNNIIWHIANGITGTIVVLSSYLFYSYFNIGIISFPIAILISYLGFYCWYSALHSYRFYKLKFWKFERKTSFSSAILLTIYFIIIFCKL